MNVNDPILLLILFHNVVVLLDFLKLCFLLTDLKVLHLILVLYHPISIKYHKSPSTNLGCPLSNNLMIFFCSEGEGISLMSDKKSIFHRNQYLLMNSDFHLLQNFGIVLHCIRNRKK